MLSEIKVLERNFLYFPIVFTTVLEFGSSSLSNIGDTRLIEIRTFLLLDQNDRRVYSGRILKTSEQSVIASESKL